MVIPWVHGDAEEKNRKGTTHIDAHVERERGAKAGAYFMEDLSAEKNAPTVNEDPIKTLPREEYVHDPMRIDSLESLGQV